MTTDSVALPEEQLKQYHAMIRQRKADAVRTVENYAKKHDKDEEFIDELLDILGLTEETDNGVIPIRISKGFNAA